LTILQENPPIIKNGKRPTQIRMLIKSRNHFGLLKKIKHYLTQLHHLSTEIGKKFVQDIHFLQNEDQKWFIKGGILWVNTF